MIFRDYLYSVEKSHIAYVYFQKSSFWFVLDFQQWLSCLVTPSDKKTVDNVNRFNQNECVSVRTSVGEHYFGNRATNSAKQMHFYGTFYQ